MPGRGPASYSGELSKGCRLHCAYVEKHGITHDEDPGKPGYTVTRGSVTLDGSTIDDGSTDNCGSIMSFIVSPNRPGAVLDEPFRRRQTDPAVASRDHRDLVVELAHGLDLLEI